MKLTAEKIESLMTPKGGYNRTTLAALSVSWPPARGWKRRLIGRELPDDLWDLAQVASKRKG